MSEEEGKVVYPGKFQQIKDRVKGKLGIASEPQIYLDAQVLMTALRESNVFKGFGTMYPDHKSYSWDFDIRDGRLYGVKVTLKQETCQ